LFSKTQPIIVLYMMNW